MLCCSDFVQSTVKLTIKRGQRPREIEFGRFCSGVGGSVDRTHLYFIVINEAF